MVGWGGWGGVGWCGVGWGGIIPFMFLYTHRHGNLIIQELPVGLCPFLFLVVRFGRWTAQILQNGSPHLFCRIGRPEAKAEHQGMKRSRKTIVTAGGTRFEGFGPLRGQNGAPERERSTEAHGERGTKTKRAAGEARFEGFGRLSRQDGPPERARSTAKQTKSGRAGEVRFERFGPLSAQSGPPQAARSTAKQIKSRRAREVRFDGFGLLSGQNGPPEESKEHRQADQEQNRWEDPFWRIWAAQRPKRNTRKRTEQGTVRVGFLHSSLHILCFDICIDWQENKHMTRLNSLLPSLGACKTANKWQDSTLCILPLGHAKLQTKTKKKKKTTLCLRHSGPVGLLGFLAFYYYFFFCFFGFADLWPTRSSLGS